MNFLSFLLAVPVLFTSLFCYSQTSLSGTIMHDGLQREYMLYVPAAYNPAEAVPVVFNFHGYTSNNFQQSLYADFRSIADTANFLIVLPNGTVDAFGNNSWNTFGATQVDDLGFVIALLDSLSNAYTIDQNRVYSTGMSNGGFMSYDLACYRSERFAAIASVTGTMLTSRLANCNATHPTPVMQIHGTADPTVNYNGGSGLEGIENIVQHWVVFNNCDPVPSVTDVPNINTSDGCTAEHYVYSGGEQGSTVEFYKVLDGGHTWPGAQFVIGVTNQDFNACREIWRFFSQYSLDQFTGISDQGKASIDVTIGPNPSAGVFQLQFDGSATRILTVYSSLGQIVRTIRSTGSKVELTLLEPGPYLLKVQEGERTRTVRLVRY